MPDLGYRLRDPILNYTSGEADKREFKQQIRRIKQNADGANWFTLSVAASEVTKHFEEEDRVAVATAFAEVFSGENMSRVFGTDLMKKANPQLDE